MRDGRRLGEVLRAEGAIDEQELEAALREQGRFGNRLGETLVRLGFLDEAALVRVLARRFRVPGLDLRGKHVEPEVLGLLPADVAEKYGCIPLFTKRQGGVEVLYLGMEDPSDLGAVDDVSFRTGLGVQPVMVGPLQLREAVAACYRGEAPEATAAPALPEAPLVPGDTAPLLLDAPPETPPEPAPAPEPASAAPAHAAGVSSAEAASATPARGKPRDVPTRQILQAVTRLLLAKGIITREELLESVRVVQIEEPRSG